jgi:predicted RNase H-like nuclease (RuvC/YqgF family)
LNNLEFTFDAAPWEDLLAAAGEAVCASELLTLLEGESEEEFEDAMLALEQRNCQLEDKIAVLARRQDLQEQLQQELEAIQAENRTLGEKLRRAEDENRRLDRNNTQLQESNQRQQADFDARQKALQAQHAATIAKLKQEYQTAYGALADELALAQGKLRAMDLAEGKEDPTEVFDTRESFSRLEAQYKAFTRYYKQQWTLAKKQLRRQLWKHPKK